MNKITQILVLGLLSISQQAIFAQNEKQNQNLFEKIAGTYLYDSKGNCKLQFLLDKEGNYSIEVNDNYAYWEKASFSKDDKLYIDFGDLSTLYEDNTITFQNYGNSMNDYEHFNQCKEKYISLKKIENLDEESSIYIPTDDKYCSIRVEDLNEVEQSLKDLDFKFPEQEFFRDRILKVYGVDINKNNSNLIALDTMEFSEIVVKNKNHILLEDFSATPDYIDEDDNEMYETYITPEFTYHYNNFIFYQDKTSFEVLKNDIQLMPLYKLVVNYGYSENKELVKYIYDFSNFGYLIFSYNKEKKKLSFRKDMLDAIVETVLEGKEKRDFSPAYDRIPFSDEEDKLLENLYAIVKKVRTSKKEYINPDEILAYLYNAQLQIGVVGYIEQKLDKEPEYISFLKQNDFFGLEKLEIYTNYIYVKAVCDYKPKLGGYEFTYCFENPDGYVNLRKEPNGKSDVLAAIPNGECVILDYESYEEKDNWINAYYYGKDCKKNIRGYIHKSQIRD